jgi:peptidoglycan/xylan/chitin deacetylase (PgdA/CDA1 family)
MKGIELKNGARIFISIDDYNPLNFEVAELLKKHDLAATFFIDTKEEAARRQIKELSDIGFEIGAHTITHHSDMKMLPLVEAKGEIETCKMQIENITGKPCTSFAFPRGRYNDELLMLAKQAGYEMARNTHVLKTTLDDPFQTPTTIHVFEGRKEYGGRKWMQLAHFYLDHVVRIGNGEFFSIWGHSWEMKRDNLLGQFDEFLGVIKQKVNENLSS